MQALVPDKVARERIEAELPQLPLRYFEDPIPVPTDWDRIPVAYIRFSVAYEAAEKEAAERGYVTETIPGKHLHAVVEPKTVANRLVEIAKRLVTLRVDL
jgi:hypothetical protein